MGVAGLLLPSVELYVDAETAAGDVEELSGIGHAAQSVRQLSRLPSFTALRRLVLHGGQLVGLEGLEAVAFTLEELNLSSNALEDLSALGSLPKLRVLNLVRPPPRSFVRSGALGGTRSRCLSVRGSRALTERAPPARCG